MLTHKKHKYILVLMLPGIVCLGSCTRAHYNYCPKYPIAGPNVASELEKYDYHTHTSLWEWIGRIDKLRQELDLCR